MVSRVWVELEGSYEFVGIVGIVGIVAIGESLDRFGMPGNKVDRMMVA